MKWDSWENKQLMHRKCKAILSPQKESHDKTDGPWVHCSGSSNPKDILKNHPPNISRPYSIQ